MQLVLRIETVAEITSRKRDPATCQSAWHNYRRQCHCDSRGKKCASPQKQQEHARIKNLHMHLEIIFCLSVFDRPSSYLPPDNLDLGTLDPTL